jgi:hypothetical protein
MSKLRCHMSVSLDGFAAEPNLSDETRLGEGGERLHDWGRFVGRLAPSPRSRVPALACATAPSHCRTQTKMGGVA